MVIAMLAPGLRGSGAPGLVGGSRTLARGTSLDVDRVVENDAQLLAVTRDGFRDAAAWYRERRTLKIDGKFPPLVNASCVRARQRPRHPRVPIQWF